MLHEAQIALSGFADQVALRGEVAHWGGSVAFAESSLMIKRAVSVFLCKGVTP